MAESTTTKGLKIEQCRKNAQAKSDRKRQDVLAAIAVLQGKQLPITKAAIKRQANVSYPFLAKHPDLLAAIETAQQNDREVRLVAEVNKNRNQEQVVTALKRRVNTLKKQLEEKEKELRKKQETIDILYGKLAIRGDLT